MSEIINPWICPNCEWKCYDKPSCPSRRNTKNTSRLQAIGRAKSAGIKLTPAQIDSYVKLRPISSLADNKLLEVILSHIKN